MYTFFYFIYFVFITVISKIIFFYKIHINIFTHTIGNWYLKLIKKTNNNANLKFKNPSKTIQTLEILQIIKA